jgi:hypothetical protein
LLGTLGTATFESMAKITLQATKLESPTVSYISLVERGANRVPFRIVKEQKSENGMIDLGKIFKRDSTPVEEVEKAEPEAAPVAASPTIVGLVVEKSECCMAEISKILGDAGFKTDAQEDQDDGTVIFKQADDITGADVVRVNSALLALVKDFPKVSSSMVAKAEGFVPGIDVTFGGLFEAVSALALSDEPAAEKISKVESFFKDASALIASHVQHLPASIFSAGVALEAMVPVAKAEEVAPVEPEIETPATPTEEVAPVEDNAELIQKVAQELLGPVLERLGSLSAAVDVLGKNVSDIAKKSETLEAKVAEASEKASSVQAVVKGTVLGAPPKGDSESPSRTTKAEGSDLRSGLFDTAFLPRRKLHSL